MEVSKVSVEGPKRRVRISVRAVVASALVELALIGMLLMLAGTFGWWPVLGERFELGAAFAVFGIAAWVASALVGGYAAAVISRSVERRDGIAHGIVTWATARVSATIAARIYVVLALAVKLVDLDTIRALAAPRVMAAFFLADALALVAAIVGGIAGSRAERAGELGAKQPEYPSVEGRPSEQQPQPAR